MKHLLNIFFCITLSCAAMNSYCQEEHPHSELPKKNIGNSLLREKLWHDRLSDVFSGIAQSRWELDKYPSSELNQALQMAKDIQDFTTEMGIRDVHIGNSMEFLMNGVRSKFKTAVKPDYWRGAREFYIQDILDQLQYLKSLKISYKGKKFIPTDSYKEGRNLVFRFRRKLEICKMIALQTDLPESERYYLPPDAVVDLYREWYFRECYLLAKRIEEIITLKKITLPVSDYDFRLFLNTEIFMNCWEKNIAIFKREWKKREWKHKQRNYYYYSELSWVERSPLLYYPKYGVKNAEEWEEIIHQNAVQKNFEKMTSMLQAIDDSLLALEKAGFPAFPPSMPTSHTNTIHPVD